jgi:hypothetical protein
MHPIESSSVLADSQRSPAVLLFAKQSGSPVRMRTYDPFVYSQGVKCFVFSNTISLHAALRRCESSAQKPKLILLRSESAVCSFAYFCCCNGKCVASCCSCRQGCAGACKGSSLVCVRSMRGVAVSPVLAFRGYRQLRASGELSCA